MNEAVETTKLRLFLALVATANPEYDEINVGIEPLPDIDFNIKCGNSLVGYSSREEIEKACYSNLFNYSMEKEIIEKLNMFSQKMQEFKSKQLEADKDKTNVKEIKEQLYDCQSEVNNILDRTMVTDGGMDEVALEEWKKNTQPFHWYSEFYSTVSKDNGNAQKTDIILDASDEIVFCKFPYEPENMDSYWQHLLYFNHYLTGFLSGNVPEEYCRKPIKQVIWVVETFKIMYVVGWAKNVQLFPTIQKVNVRGSGVGTIEYQFKYIQDEGKVLLPCNVFECLFEGESPASLVKQGICKSSEIDGGILKEIVDIVNSYDGDYIDVGIMDSTLDAIPGIETDNVSELIKLANEADSRDRRFLIMNKAVSLEKSYRTYLHRGLAFFDCWIFDKALDDFSKALQYEKDDLEMIEKPEVEKYIMKVQKAMTVLK